MSLKRELKEKNAVSFVELFETIMPEEKTKYYELFSKIIENSTNNDNFQEKIIRIKKYFIELSDKKEKVNELLSKISNNKILQLNSLFNVFDGDCEFDFELLKDFVKYNERNLIEQKDLSLYKTYDDIVKQVSISSIKINDKELAKQIKVLYQDNEWLVLKPLSYKSSVKYGYGTKWCTAMSYTSDYFRRYTSEGSLIYTINKLTGEKVATFKDLVSFKYNEVSFWDMLDKRVDSIQLKLTPKIISVIIDDIDNNNKTNNDILKEYVGEDINKYIFNENEIEKFSDGKKLYKNYKEPVLSEEPQLQTLINDYGTNECISASIDIE